MLDSNGNNSKNSNINNNNNNVLFLTVFYSITFPSLFIYLLFSLIVQFFFRTPGTFHLSVF